VVPMYDVELIHVADILQLLTIFFTLLGFLPQLITLRVTKNSQGVSQSAWILWAVGSSMTLFYALVHYWFEGCCLPFVITTVVNCVLSLVMLVLIILYRVAPCHPKLRYTSSFRDLLRELVMTSNGTSSLSQPMVEPTSDDMDRNGLS